MLVAREADGKMLGGYLKLQTLEKGVRGVSRNKSIEKQLDLQFALNSPCLRGIGHFLVWVSLLFNLSHSLQVDTL